MRVNNGRHIPRIDIVGEIFVKYNNFGHGNIVNWLISQGVEPVVPPLSNFFTSFFASRVARERGRVDTTSRLVQPFVDLAEKFVFKMIHKMEDHAAAFPFIDRVESPHVMARHASDIISLNAQFGEGFWLIFCGLFKKAVISDFISLNFVDRIFDNPMLYTGLENLMGVLGYALQIYCDFSGYSDMAIGIALLLGFRFNANFDSPYKSATITEFWRRWHISLSSWLKDYLYISLGGNRRGKLRTYLNLMLTMLLGGLWHGAAMRFIVWGGLHGAALALHKWTMGRFPSSFRPLGMQMSRGRRVVGILLTFSFVCATWVFFRAPSMEIAGQVFSQIFTAFHPEIFFDFVAGYRWVVLLMAVGYVLHFASARVEAGTMRLVQRMPIVLYAVMMTALIWLIMQMRNGDVQPFIYFQF